MKSWKTLLTPEFEQVLTRQPASQLGSLMKHLVMLQKKKEKEKGNFCSTSRAVISLRGNSGSPGA